jgi:hypothetical protein
MLANHITIREIKIGSCLFDAKCSARRRRRPARVVARAFDTGGRPVKQYELCLEHGRHIAERESTRLLRTLSGWIEASCRAVVVA